MTAPSRVAVVAGTRPEIIKLAPIVSALQARFGPQATLVVDTGQHYDHAMSGSFWTQLSVRPDVVLHAGALSRAQCIGYLTATIGEVLSRREPVAVIVQGDTNSTLAGALAAIAERTPLVHVEAGLRSGDRRMPEEDNRIVVDHLADLCCAGTAANASNLRDEGILDDRVVVTGNTIVESVAARLPARDQQLAIVSAHRLRPGSYLLATIHRPENTDDPAVLAEILRSLNRLARTLPVLVALHPRTRQAVTRAGLTDLLSPLHVTGPLGGVEFLSLAAQAAVIVSDSGGIAEEVTVLKRPLIIVRRSTERPESVTTGFARLVGPGEIVPAVRTIIGDCRSVHRRLAATPSPYGDGAASQQIAALMSRYLPTASSHGA